jgi:hypothetical protein
MLHQKKYFFIFLWLRDKVMTHRIDLKSKQKWRIMSYKRDAAGLKTFQGPL